MTSFLGITSVNGASGIRSAGNVSSNKFVSSNIAAIGTGNLIPQVLNDNPDRGVVRTFDSYNCFGFEPCI